MALVSNVQRAYPPNYGVNPCSLAKWPRPVARSTADRGVNRVLIDADLHQGNVRRESGEGNNRSVARPVDGRSRYGFGPGRHDLPTDRQRCHP